MALNTLLNWLSLLASIVFLVAVYYCFKLSKETKHERYWLTLALGFFIFAVHHWTTPLWAFGIVSELTKSIIEQVSSILGALLIGYSTYGLYTSIRKVKERV